MCFRPDVSYLLRIARRIFIADQAVFKLNAGCLRPDAGLQGRVRAVQLGVFLVFYWRDLGVFENL